MGNPRLPRVRYILGELVGHVTSIAQIKTVSGHNKLWRRRRNISFSLLLTTRAALFSLCFLSRAQAIVRIPRWHRNTKLDFDTRRNSKIWAHDEYDLCSVGDKVRIEPCRALSKRKAHVVVEILKKEDGSPPPVPFPKW